LGGFGGLLFSTFAPDTARKGQQGSLVGYVISVSAEDASSMMGGEILRYSGQERR
jgi:hypothetical protein